jgi:uncharacterized membrane protein
MTSDGTPTRARLLLAAFLTATGVSHIVWPTPFERLIPRWVPGSAVAWNRIATAAELGSAGLLAVRRTARLGGIAAFVTFAGVWVANIQAALDGGYRALPGRLGGAAVAWVRVPLQVPLLWWAATIARRSDEPEA